MKLFRKKRNQSFIAWAAEDIFIQGLQPGINKHPKAIPELEEKIFNIMEVVSLQYKTIQAVERVCLKSPIW